MADVKWIKLSIELFDDEKIDFIQSLPEGDSILVIWVRLLVLAGKCNDDGYIYLTEEIPYTEDTLAYKFRKQNNIVKLALETFQRLNMIIIDKKGILLCNWSKYQNLESMQKIKEQTRKRVAKHRQKKKEIEGAAKGEICCNVTSIVTETPNNAPREKREERRKKKEDIEKEREKRKEEDNSVSSADFSLEGCKYYEKAGFGTVSQITLDKISDMVNEFTFQWFKDALDIAVMRNKKSLSYVQGVLNNWRAEGRREKNEPTSRYKEDASSMYDFSEFGG